MCTCHKFCLLTLRLQCVYGHIIGLKCSEMITFMLPLLLLNFFGGIREIGLRKKPLHLHYTHLTECQGLRLNLGKT